MARKTPLSTCLALIVCIGAIVLGGWLIVDGIRHPAIGATCGWILWDSTSASHMTCSMKDACVGHGGWREHRSLRAVSPYNTQEECQARAEKMLENEVAHREQRKEAASARGDTSYTTMVNHSHPQCWPVGHNPND